MVGLGSRPGPRLPMPGGQIGFVLMAFGQDCLSPAEPASQVSRQPKFTNKEPCQSQAQETNSCFGVRLARKVPHATTASFPSTGKEASSRRFSVRQTYNPTAARCRANLESRSSANRTMPA